MADFVGLEVFEYRPVGKYLRFGGRSHSIWFLRKVCSDCFLCTFMSNASTNEVAVLKTSYGEITIGFWSDVAPKTVENFKKLAHEGFYDGTAFHRIIKGFMVQGGCPNTKAGETGMPGTGGPGYKIKAEFNAKSHVRGVISMARSAQPDSAGACPVQMQWPAHSQAGFAGRGRGAHAPDRFREPIA